MKDEIIARKLVDNIIECWRAWENDDGVMAMNNEKTPDDIVMEALTQTRRDVIREIKKKLEEYNKFMGKDSYWNKVGYYNSIKSILNNLER